MCAFRGVWDAILDEAHLRFHLVAAFYVLLFSPFFELSAAQYAVLVLTPVGMNVDVVEIHESRNAGQEG